MLSGIPLMAGCPGSIDDPLEFRRNVGGTTCPPDFDVEQEIFKPTCGTLGCHTGGQFAAAGLDLTSPGIGERILAHTSGECGVPLIEGEDVEGSYFVAKLGDEPPCGARMPSGMDELNLSERACVEAYLSDLVGAGDAPADAGAGQ